MNPFLAGEADAYAKRNAGHNPVEPWFIGLLRTIQFQSVADMGGGDGERIHAICDAFPAVKRAICVDAKSGQSFDDGRLAMLYNHNAEGWNGEDIDLLIFSYTLHWMPNAERALEQLSSFAKYTLINDFFPGEPIDNPYAHAPGIVTRKRRWGLYLAEAGWKLHAEVRYPYKNEIGGEKCACQIWRKPCGSS